MRCRKILLTLDCTNKNSPHRNDTEYFAATIYLGRKLRAPLSSIGWNPNVNVQYKNKVVNTRNFCIDCSVLEKIRTGESSYNSM